MHEWRQRRRVTVADLLWRNLSAARDRWVGTEIRAGKGAAHWVPLWIWKTNGEKRWEKLAKRCLLRNIVSTCIALCGFWVSLKILMRRWCKFCVSKLAVERILFCWMLCGAQNWSVGSRCGNLTLACLVANVAMREVTSRAFLSPWVIWGSRYTSNASGTTATSVSPGIMRHK